MDNIFLDKTYWNDRYINKKTGWDIGHPSTPIVNYFNQVENKNLKILIPGCGNAYEAEHLFKKGFKQVFVLDYAEQALTEFAKRFPKFPKTHLLNDDFFNHNNKYDLIIEQTFFCALNPELRSNYVKKCHHLLNSKGKLIGVLFKDKLDKNPPPFTASKKEYLNLFSSYFNINVLEDCTNSIEQRLGNELFINIIKKDV